MEDEIRKLRNELIEWENAGLEDFAKFLEEIES